MTELYKLPITELKTRHTDFIIGRAIRKWKKEVDYEEIPLKLEKLTTRLEHSGKAEFIAILNGYSKTMEV